MQNCTFEFKQDGLVLTINAGEEIWTSKSNPGKTLTFLELDDRGCLFLNGSEETNSVWRSFDYPSDIIITEQTLNVSNRLRAAQVNNQYLNGKSYYMEVTQNEVILTNGTSELESIYKNLTGKPIHYVEMRNGLRVVTENEVVNVGANFFIEPKSLWQYARVDATGHLVIASYFDFQSNGEFYGLCSGNATCHCPDGFRSVNDSACQRNVNLDSTECTKGNSVDSFTNVSGMTYSGFMTNSTIIPNASPDNCSSHCMDDCNCQMALHVKNPNQDLGTCYTNLGDSLQAVTKRGDNNNSTSLQTLFLRIHNGTLHSGGATKSAKSSRKTAASAFAGGAGALVLVLLLVSAWYLYDSRRKLLAHADSGKWDSASTELLSSRRLPQFTYQELVESTGNFHQKLGSGGFSSVYAGHLPDNTKIAVKKLDDNEQKEKEFPAAVTTIGSISHPNLVPLLGFCKEGQHRILVYEFVNEGRSLNWYLFPTNSSLLINAQTRRAIALGAARGLAHLHEVCNLLHGNVKPENIVMDRNYHPRLVDFGLGTLMSRDHRISAATMRNSHCYMAPEWAKSQPITEKADVYSLGVVILELVSGRRCLKQGASPEKSFLPTWGFSLLRDDEDDPDCVLALVDPRLDVRSLPATDQQLLKGIIFVALWCVQENAALRPPTKEVVRMLEGDASVNTPPPSPAADAFAREMCAGSSGHERAPESSYNSFMHSTSLSRNSDMLLR